jgi:hypothetical protein
MIKIYGYAKINSLIINDDYRRFLIGTYTREQATKILNDRNFISRWNDNHVGEIVKISIEIEEI